MVDISPESLQMTVVYVSVLFAAITASMIACKKKRANSDSSLMTQATQGDTTANSVVDSVGPDSTGTDGNDEMFKWDTKLKTDDEEKCNTDLDDLEDDNPLQNPKLREKLGKGKASGKEKKNEKQEPNGKTGQKAEVRFKKSHDVCPRLAQARKMPPSAAPPTALSPAPSTSPAPAPCPMPSPSDPTTMSPSKPDKCPTMTQASQMVEPTMEGGTQSIYNNGTTMVTQMGGVSKEPTPTQTQSQFGQTTQGHDVSRIQPSQIQTSVLPSEISVDVPRPPSMMHSVSMAPASDNEKKKHHSRKGDKSADKHHRKKKMKSGGKGKMGSKDEKFQQAKESSSHDIQGNVKDTTSPDGSSLSNQSSRRDSSSSVKGGKAAKNIPSDSLMQPPVSTSTPEEQKKRVTSKSFISNAP